MNNIFEIYDPVNLKLYSLDLNEIRFWLDIPKLQQDYSRIPELRQSFTALETDKREYFLKLMDRHEVMLPFQIRHWVGIPGVALSIDMNVVHTHEAPVHYDQLNESVKDQLFYEKRLSTLPQNANIFVDNQYFPVRSIYAISEDFWDVRDLSAEQPLPIFQKNLNSDPQSDSRIVLNYKGEVEPVDIIIPFMYVDNWLYQMRVRFEVNVDSSQVLWPNIPNVKPLYEFFNSLGYKPKGDTSKRVIWENEKTGDIVEYNTPPQHLYFPFIVVRQHNGKTDLLSRNALGDNLVQRMKKQGLWEEILYFRAYLLETEALGKIQNKNKTFADQILSEAIMKYDECEDHMWSQAQTEAIFCAWLKSRIAVHKGDKEVEYKSYLSMAKRFAETHSWKQFAWLLDKVYEEDRKMPMRIIKEFLPMPILDKYYFTEQSSYKRILEYWDKAYAREKRPSDVNPSKWHYTLAKQAFDIGLKETARTHLMAFFRETERSKEAMNWAIEGTDELLEFAVKLDAKERYFKFAQNMVKNILRLKKEEGIGDMSAIGRKSYRWLLLVMTLAESRWAFHAAVLLQKAQKEKKDQIRSWFKQAYEFFYESVLHYDSTEDYTVEQSRLIGSGFVNAYHLGFTCKDENLMKYAQNLSNELWEKMPSKELYVVIHGIFPTDKRQEMADLLIGNWINELKEKEGSFTLDVPKVIELTDLYLSVEEWDEAAKTMKYGLDKFEWDFFDLNSLFESFLSLQKFSPQHSVLCQEAMFRWITIYQQEKQQTQRFIPSLLGRIKKIQKV